jgi:hypothetical protein
MSVFRIALVASVLVAVAVAPAAAEVEALQEDTGFALVAGQGTAVNPRFPNIRFEIEVYAIRRADGAVWGTYRHGGSGGFVVQARCLRTEANRAVVGGIIVRSPSAPSQVGMGASLVIEDRGDFGRPLGDRLISGVGPPGNFCPFSPANVLGPFDDVVSGDFTVMAGSFGLGN